METTNGELLPDLACKESTAGDTPLKCGAVLLYLFPPDTCLGYTSSITPVKFLYEHHGAFYRWLGHDYQRGCRNNIERDRRRAESAGHQYLTNP